MEPRQQHQPKTSEPKQESRPKRFRLIKLEERIAPSTGGKGTHNGCVLTQTCFCHHTFA
jgi:hypothetical protein